MADILAPIAEEGHLLWNGVYLSGTGRMFVNYPMITAPPHSSVAEVNQAGVGNPLLARSGVRGIRANLLRQLSLAPMLCASVQREICGSCQDQRLTIRHAHHHTVNADRTAPRRTLFVIQNASRALRQACSRDGWTIQTFHAVEMPGKRLEI